MFDTAEGNVSVVYQHTFAMLRKESDRGAALLAGVLLEGAIDGLLAKHLKCLPKNKKPRRDFASKIDLAYQLQCIDEGMYACLHALRNARNTFAHKLVSNMEEKELEKAFSDLFRSVLTQYPNLMDKWIDGINAVSQKHGAGRIVNEASDLTIRIRFDNFVTILVSDLFRQGST
ncbi:DUF4145 domain-containing protein [Stutzerimonas nitrititolerans]|uniref:DUF4145 domain-containing protein n=1 Tax=Stutzerimonas nitrititolerans TaxID=2482751 RepID=UPI0028B21C0A|nr:DUF4145 domain-containing protein [Stutzerimonas nitrititolerans]